MKMKKYLSFALVLAMLAGMLPGMSQPASAAGNTNTITSPNTTGTMTITLHIHNFTEYKLGTTNAANDTIIATCTDKDHHADGQNYGAKLVISAPTQGGGAASITDDDGIKGTANVMYQSKDGSDWGTATETPPNGNGFYKASITLGEKEAYVTYGVNAITTDKTYSAETDHGTVTVPSVATANATVTIETTPATGYELDEINAWKTADTEKVNLATKGTGDKSDTGTFTMPEENVTVSASFRLHPYTITKSEMTNGSVTVAATAKMDDTVTVTVNPDTGYELDTLKYDTTDITATNGVYSFTMPAKDVAVTATFKKINYTIGKANIENGSITVKKDTTEITQAQIGDAVTLSNSPADGYQLASYTVTKTDDSTVSVMVNNDGTFQMPAHPVTVSATFVPIDYTVTIDSAISNGTVTANKGSAEVPAHYRDEITLTVTPNYGYGLKTLTVTGANNSTVTVTDNKFTMPASNVNVSAVFAELTPYTVFYKTNDGVTSVKCRIDGAEYDMTKNASLGGTACWAARFSAADGKSSFSASFSTDNGSTWSNVASKTPQDTIPSSLNNDDSAVMKGGANALILALSKGTESESSSVDFYLVTGNTTSISIPNPTRDGYTFVGWEYNKIAAGSATTMTINAGTGSTAIPVSGQITGSTIISAVWEKITPTVTFTEVGGISPQALEYAHTATKPADPTKEGYALVGWALAEKSIQRVNDTDRLLGAGSLFDFENTKVISDVALKPVWKHVHSYVYRQINDFSALSAYSAYNSYYHVRICTGGCGSIDLEPHNLNSLGRCACGYVSPNGKYLVTPYTEGAKSSSVYMVKPNSEFQLFAPLTKGTQQFSKWQYRLSESGQWNDLSAYNSTGIIVPADLNVNATYKSLNDPDLYLYSFLNNGHLYFQFDYTLPTGWTAQDAYILSGNNFMLRYMQWNEVGAMDVRFAYETKNAITELGKDTIRNKMVNGKAVNISGGSDVRLTRVSNVGNSGTVRDGYHADDVARDNGEMFFYAVGVVRCKDKAGAQRFLITDPIWATQKSQNDHYSNHES